MPPGRLLDVLVAEMVMGWELDQDTDKWYDGEFADILLSEWNPSTDIAVAWKVMDKFKNNIKLESWDGFICEICNPKCQKVHAKTAPEAICKAALLAVAIA